MLKSAQSDDDVLVTPMLRYTKKKWRVIPRINERRFDWNWPALNTVIDCDCFLQSLWHLDSKAKPGTV
jgi:hypothetical protein